LLFWRKSLFFETPLPALLIETETIKSSLVLNAKTHGAHCLVVDTNGIGKDDVQFLLGARAFGEFVIVMISDQSDTEISGELADRVVTRETDAEGLYAAIAEAGAHIKVTRAYVREGKKGYKDGASLTRREYEVAVLISKGLSNRRISQVSGLREQSVKNLVSVIMRKLKCENRTQVALKLLNMPIPNDADLGASE
jgi:DNA-binding NarL/FixJ family response regulator